ncbi:phage holin family protein [Paenarthrobacter sp. OM7]|uniref:Phage holin family protein n=1 Tax=Paenarthrobacter sp. AMU7 TaxID=3162492 RepID=A0AB39YNC7_9MICC|nr:phage holin family protein [Paenarthrobacter sp. OM7]WGM20437.1 phage holin family protein [Paenarthrobacter sp. OM7]
MLLQWLVLTTVLVLTALIIPSVSITGGLLGLVAAAAVFGLTNALIGPLLRLLTLPLSVATFGVFALVVNGLLLGLAAGLSRFLSVGGPVATIVAALVVSVFSSLGYWLIDRNLDRGAAGHRHGGS